MMRGKASNQNKLVRLIKAPIRILSKARDSYVRSWGDSTQSVCYSRTYRSHDPLPRSFSAGIVSNSRVVEQHDDDFRELVRVASVRTLTRTMEMDMIEQRRAKRFAKKQPNGVSRSASVGIGMGRIDEDEACEFVEEDLNKKKMKKKSVGVGKKNGMLYPRSRSHAVSNSSLMMMS